MTQKFVCPTLAVANGRLTLGGADVTALAKKYGTPLYLMDENYIRSVCSQFNKAITKHHSGEAMAYYSIKAFCCKEICRIVESQGLGIDVTSGGELYTVRAAGFPMDRVLYHSNNKSDAEVALGLECGVRRFMADNNEELTRLSRMASEAGKTADVTFRLKPGVRADTICKLQTAVEDCKFGLSMATGEAEEAILRASKLPGLRLCGIHCHIGSHFFSADPFIEAARLFTGFLAMLRDKHGILLTEVNLGGGFGIPYTGADKPCDIDAVVAELCAAVEAGRVQHGLPPLRLEIEPGRAVVGASGITVYTVGSVKEVPGIRRYAITDGGMTDNPRFCLYGSKYQAVLANKPVEPHDTPYTLAGRCCEPGDVIGQDILLPESLQAGDLAAVQVTGAYNYSMASHYNRLPNLPVVMIRDGIDRLAVRRETYEDLLTCDL